MIRLNDVHYAHGTGNAAIKLQNINCEFLRHHHTAILIADQAIRKALIRLITGMLIPDRGYCQVEGLVSWPPSWVHLFTPNLTATENITFLSRLYGYKASETLAFVREFSGLGKELRQKFSALDFKNKLRICFLTAMAIPFDYYVSDGEFTVGFGDNPEFQETVKLIVSARLQTSSAIAFIGSPVFARLYSRIYVYSDDGMRYFEDPVKATQCFNLIQTQNR